MFAFDHGIMVAVQSLYQLFGAAADALFLAFTFLGEESFGFILIFAIYWCLDRRLGEYMIFSVYCAISANGILKDAVRRLRPFLNPDYADLRYLRYHGLLVDTAALGDSFSFPSGHSQTAANLFSSLALYFRRRGFFWLAALGTLAVMTSRVYLGVHYPTDTIAGAALGLLCAWLCHLLYERFYPHRLALMAAAVALSTLSLLGNFTVDTVKTLGLGCGAVLGIALEGRFVRFSTDGTPPKKLLRLALGLALVIAVRAGLKPLLPDLLFFHALRYAAVGFTAMYLWPLCFTRLRI